MWRLCRASALSMWLTDCQVRWRMRIGGVLGSGMFLLIKWRHR